MAYYIPEMKKIITLILLLGVAGTGFFLGWAQFSIPAGSFGVLRSKTHGVENEVLQEGKIRWVWYKLIPNNVTIAVYSITETTLPVDFSGSLPSGDVYSTLAGQKTDFSYHFSVSISYSIKTESLPALSESENLFGQADLDAYRSRLSQEIENYSRTLLWTYGENETILNEILETGTIKALERELTSAFPQIRVSNCTVRTLRFPDLILYNEMRQLYRDYLETQRTDLQNTIAHISAENIQTRRRMDELTAYGELLSKYPILLQYLALEKGVWNEPSQ